MLRASYQGLERFSELLNSSIPYRDKDSTTKNETKTGSDTVGNQSNLKNGTQANSQAAGDYIIDELNEMPRRGEGNHQNNHSHNNSHSQTSSSRIADEIWYQTATFPYSWMRYLKQLYPAMNDHPAYFRFAVALIRKWIRTDKDGYPMVSCKLLARIAHRSVKHFNASQFLDGYKAAIDPDLIYREYHHDKGLARVLTQTGTATIARKLHTHVESKKRVFVNTQETVTAKKRQERIQHMLEFLKNNSNGFHPIQTQLLTYLHTRSYQFYETRIKQYVSSVRKAYPNYDGPITSLLDFALPYYTLSQNAPFSQCPRLFPHGLPLLPKRIRALLLPDCQEIDICNAHLLLAVSITDCGYDLYNQIGNMWQYLYNSLGVTSRMKPLLKKLYCSLIYGMDTERAKQQFLSGFYSKSKGCANTKMSLRAFFDEPTSKSIADHFFSEDNLVFQLIQRVNTALQQRYSKRFPLPEGFSQTELQRLDHQKLYSFLSSGLQSWELYFISKVYEYAELLRQRNKQSFDVVLHQHDGVTIWTKAGSIEQLGIEKYLQDCYHRCFPESQIELRLSIG